MLVQTPYNTPLPHKTYPDTPRSARSTFFVRMRDYANCARAFLVCVISAFLFESVCQIVKAFQRSLRE